MTGLARLSACFLISIWALAGSAHVSAQSLNYDQLIKAGIEVRNRGEMAEAETYFRQAYELAAIKAEATYLLALVLAFQDKFEEAEQLVAEGLTRYPENLELMLANARILSYQGDFDAAISAAERVTAVSPGNLEAKNLMARISLYKRDYEKGQAAYLSVLDQDPQNLEAIVGLYDTDMALGNEQAALKRLLQAQAIAPDHEDVVARSERRAVSTLPQHEIIMGFGRSRFDLGNFPSWRDYFLEYRHGTVGQNQQYLRLEFSKRFGLNDGYLEGGINLKNLRFPLELSVGVGRDEHFLPSHRQQVFVELGRFRGKQWFGTLVSRLGYRRSEFSSGNVSQWYLQGDYYLRDSPAWLTPGIITTEDENGRRSTGWTLGYHHQASSRVSVGMSFSDAPETEANRTRDTTALHGYMRVRLSNRSSVRLDYTRNHREDSYRRNHLSATYSYRF